jgi:hypothetical protein
MCHASATEALALVDHAHGVSFTFVAGEILGNLSGGLPSG